MRLSLLINCLITFCLFFSFQFISASAQQPNHERQLTAKLYQLTDERNADQKVFNQALTSQDSQLQKKALLGLARIGGKPVISLVEPFLSDPDESLRKLAAFALGLSANKEAAHYLWQRLALEKSVSVKQEIYLGLGNLGQNRLVSKMLERLAKESSRDAQAALFQGLAIALTFHRELVDDYSQIDYQTLLNLFAVGDDSAAPVGLFLSRVPEIEKYLKADSLLPLTEKSLSPLATGILARLINKLTPSDAQLSETHRMLLAWLLEQSNSEILSIQLEATRALKNYLSLPQAQIQIGKLHISANPIVAQTALKTIADSNLKSPEVIKLLKKQLSNENPSMVVEAISGLISRQDKEEMSWMLPFFSHHNSYVKIQLMQLLKTMLSI